MNIEEEIPRYLDAIKALINRDVKLTLMVRVPDDPDRDRLITDDDVDDVVTAILRARNGFKRKNL